jgi:hypothetical protein
LAASFFHWPKIVAELFQFDLDKLSDGGGPRCMIQTRLVGRETSPSAREPETGCFRR